MISDRFGIETTTATAPAHWASYLINGDATGFDYSNTPTSNVGDLDLARCQAWEKRLAKDGWRIVGCDEESFFASRCDAGGLAGDMLTYHMLRSTK